MTSLKAPSRVPLYLSLLVAFHIAIVIASNYLVQLPINLLGFHSTWGAFSFPFIFLATDLTVRLIGKAEARRVITRAMLPALVASYVVGVLFHEGRFNGWAALGDFNTFVFRIAFASFAAYVLGQLLDNISTGNTGSLSTDAFIVNVLDDSGQLTIEVTDRATGEVSEIKVNGLAP